MSQITANFGWKLLHNPWGFRKISVCKDFYLPARKNSFNLP